MTISRWIRLSLHTLLKQNNVFYGLTLLLKQVILLI
jgi:hypothetical protein